MLAMGAVPSSDTTDSTMRVSLSAVLLLTTRVAFAAGRVATRPSLSRYSLTSDGLTRTPPLAIVA
jgi:hypothetical protein